MKKILALVLAAIMALGFVGCDDDSKKEVNYTPNEFSESSSINETNNTTSPENLYTTIENTSKNIQQYTTSTYKNPPVSQKHTHTYSSEVIKESTCESEGEILYTCTGCGNTYTKKVKALGHTTDNGTCSRCGVKIVNTQFIEDMAVLAVKDLYKRYNVPIDVCRITYVEGVVDPVAGKVVPNAEYSHEMQIEYFVQNGFGGSNKESSIYYVYDSSVSYDRDASANYQHARILNFGTELNVKKVLSRV